MRIKLLFLLFFTFSLSSFVDSHKFYVSVTNIEHSEKDNALQITSRIFIDDLENVIQERYGVTLNLATDKELEAADDYIAKYFRQKFVVMLDGEVLPYQFLGKKYDNDVTICYLELPEAHLGERKTLAVENDLLTDIFEEQKNIVHVKLKGNKRSFVLIKENNKGMLNL